MRDYTSTTLDGARGRHDREPVPNDEWWDDQDEAMPAWDEDVEDAEDEDDLDD